ALEARAVDVDGVQVELAPARIAVVAREEDAPPRRMEEGRERRGIEIRHLAGLGAVRVRHVDLELRGANEALREQALVLLEVLTARSRSAPHDLLALGVEERAAVVARRVRQPADVAAIRVHPIKLEIAVAPGGEDA